MTRRRSLRPFDVRFARDPVRGFELAAYLARDELMTRSGVLEAEAFQLVSVKLPDRHGALPPLFDDRAHDASTEELLRALVEECARWGITPSNSEALIGAKDKHLEDMRALAFGALKIEPPR